MISFLVIPLYVKVVWFIQRWGHITELIDLQVSTTYAGIED